MYNPKTMIGVAIAQTIKQMNLPPKEIDRNHSKEFVKLVCIKLTKVLMVQVGQCFCLKRVNLYYCAEDMKGTKNLRYLTIFGG
jgi:hypothetical protein